MKMTELRARIYDSTKIYLDFRTHRFLDNQYGGSPSFRYDIACEIVESVNAILSVDDFRVYNTSMQIESLRSQSLRVYLDNLLFDYNRYHNSRASL